MRSILRYPLHLLKGLADRVAAVAGAVAMSQFPGFVQHYVQRLGGHVAEATKSVADWQTIADKTTSGDLPGLVAHYQACGLVEVIEVGKKCAADVERLRRLQESFDALSNASAWSKGWTFLRHCDAEVFGATVRSFVPNVPLDVESLCYAVVGLVLAVVFFAVTRTLVARTARKSVTAIRGRVARRKLKRHHTASSTPESERRDSGSETTYGE